jgi:hypothetical protein
MSTHLHELVLIHIADRPVAYARVEGVEPDVKRGWWRVRFLLLTLPAQEMTWILQEEQLDGEPFTMGGTPVRLSRIDSAAESPSPDEGIPPNPIPSGAVIPLDARRKRR